MAVRAASSEGRRGRLRAVESLAGWVFADMLLVLFLVGIGTAVSQEPPPPPPPPPKAAKPQPEIVGMKTAPIKRSIPVNAEGIAGRNKRAQKAACAALRQRFRPQIAHGDRAAFVLIFGGGSDPSDAAVVAERLYPQLNCADPKLFPRNTVGRFYWDGHMARDQARVELFVYTTRKS